MTSITKQVADGFILHSSGAIGADTLFGTNAEWYGSTEQNYSFRYYKNCRSRGRVIQDEFQLRQADADLLIAIGNAFKKYQASGKSAEKYRQRNWYQVQRTKEIFAIVKNIAWLLDFTKDRIEGTATGIVLAVKTKCRFQRIYIYNQAFHTVGIYGS